MIIQYIFNIKWTHPVRELHSDSTSLAIVLEWSTKLACCLKSWILKWRFFYIDYVSWHAQMTWSVLVAFQFAFFFNIDTYYMKHRQRPLIWCLKKYCDSWKFRNACLENKGKMKGKIYYISKEKNSLLLWFILSVKFVLNFEV